MVNHYYYSFINFVDTILNNTEVKLCHQLPLEPNQT